LITLNSDSQEYAMRFPSPRVLVTFALLLLAAVATLAQETGVSNPDPVVTTAEAPALTGTTATETVTITTKPSPAIPDAHAPVLPPDGGVTTMPPVAATDTKADPSADYGIVSRIPTKPGELAEGTLLRVNIDEEISTSFTRPGAPFTARTISDVLQDGHVIIPVGSLLMGRVTRVSSARRIVGRAKIHLRADEMILPDGTRLILHAQVIDTASTTRTKTDGEGTIISKDDAKKNFAIAGATTGTGAIAGAVFGGGLGAAVGAVAGAGIGTAHYLMAHQTATLPKDSALVFQLTEPMPITPLHVE
jgi:hypothetical protein